jgi:hypothetical protein
MWLVTASSSQEAQAGKAIQMATDRQVTCSGG